MRLSPTFSRYVGRQFLFAFATTLAAFLIVIFIADTVELLRRVAGKPHVGFAMVIEMSLLKLPYLGQQTFPFAALFSGMLVFWRLSRHHELTVVRACGVSAWQFLLPVLAVAALLGAFQVAVVNPFASGLLSLYDRKEAFLVDKVRSTLSLSAGGIWLRQADGGVQSVIHASRVLQQSDDVELRDVTVFNYEGDDRFAGRIDADSARLEKGQWRLHDVWVSTPEQPSKHVEALELPTDLTLAKIQESFAPPETISFWKLPGFIRTLETAGFSAVGHRLQFHIMLAAPLLMCAMVLIAATFSLRHPRRGGTTYIIAGGILSGFLLHVCSNLIFAIGLSDRVPVVLAAWTPAVVATLLGAASLLHLEDG